MCCGLARCRNGQNYQKGKTAGARLQISQGPGKTLCFCKFTKCPQTFERTRFEIQRHLFCVEVELLCCISSSTINTNYAPLCTERHRHDCQLNFQHENRLLYSRIIILKHSCHRLGDILNHGFLNDGDIIRAASFFCGVQHNSSSCPH